MSVARYSPQAGPAGSNGAAGPQGPPGLVWRGPWATGPTFAINDTVSWAGSAWTAIAGSVGVMPGTDGTRWQLLAAAGETSPSTALTFASTLNTNAALSNYFRVTLTGNFTLANPTFNGASIPDGYTVTWEFIQDGTGSRVMTLGSAFAAGAPGSTLTTSANKRDFLTAMFNSTTGKWYIVALAKGF